MHFCVCARAALFRAKWDRFFYHDAKRCISIGFAIRSHRAIFLVRSLDFFARTRTRATECWQSCQSRLVDCGWAAAAGLRVRRTEVSSAKLGVLTERAGQTELVNGRN